MAHIHIDVPRLLIEFLNDENLFLRLDDIHPRGMGKDQKSWNTRRPAPLARDERNLSGAHIGIGLGHLLDNPGLQNGMGKVGDAAGLLLAGAVGNIGMAELRYDGAVPVWWGQEIILGGAILQPIGREV